MQELHWPKWETESNSTKVGDNAGGTSSTEEPGAGEDQSVSGPGRSVQNPAEGGSSEPYSPSSKPQRQAYGQNLKGNITREVLFVF